MREKLLRDTVKIPDTIRALAHPGMKPKELIEQVKARHPDAHRKEIARAAFLSVIMSSDIVQKTYMRSTTLRTIRETTRDVMKLRAA